VLLRQFLRKEILVGFDVMCYYSVRFVCACLQTVNCKSACFSRVFGITDVRCSRCSLCRKNFRRNFSMLCGIILWLKCSCYLPFVWHSINLWGVTPIDVMWWLIQKKNVMVCFNVLGMCLMWSHEALSQESYAWVRSHIPRNFLYLLGLSRKWYLNCLYVSV
jgi:hypothetical protein